MLKTAQGIPFWGDDMVRSSWFTCRKHWKQLVSETPMNLMNLIRLIWVNHEYHDQCFLDPLWRCQQPILDVNLVKRPMPIPKPRPWDAWDILQQDKQIKQVLHHVIASYCIFWNSFGTSWPEIFLPFSIRYGSRLRVVFHQRGKGNSVGTNPRSHPEGWEICKQNEPMHDMELTWKSWNKLI